MISMHALHLLSPSSNQRQWMMCRLAVYPRYGRQGTSLPARIVITRRKNIINLQMNRRKLYTRSAPNMDTSLDCKPARSCQAKRWRSRRQISPTRQSLALLVLLPRNLKWLLWSLKAKESRTLYWLMDLPAKSLAQSVPTLLLHTRRVRQPRDHKRLQLYVLFVMWNKWTSMKQTLIWTVMPINVY
jgi:hypothetical protein